MHLSKCGIDVTCGKYNGMLYICISSLILVVFVFLHSVLFECLGWQLGILTMIYSGPGNAVDVPPPVAAAQVHQVPAVHHHRRHHHRIQVLVHQGQVHNRGRGPHQGLGSHSKNGGRGNAGLHYSGGFVDNSVAHSGQVASV